MVFDGKNRARLSTQAKNVLWGKGTDRSLQAERDRMFSQWKDAGHAEKQENICKGNWEALDSA